MPAKKSTKKAVAKKAAAKKKAVKQKAAAKAKAPARKKAQVKKETPARKKMAAKKPAVDQKTEMPSVKPEAILPTEEKPEAKPETTREMVECPHCGGVGKCTYGEIYDMDRHQTLFAEQRLTSCTACLEAAGKPHNSKKLVACRICKGSGQVPKGEPIAET